MSLAFACSRANVALISSACSLMCARVSGWASPSTLAATGPRARIQPVRGGRGPRPLLRADGRPTHGWKAEVETHRSHPRAPSVEATCSVAVDTRARLARYTYLGRRTELLVTSQSAWFHRTPVWSSVPWARVPDMQSGHHT